MKPKAIILLGMLSLFMTTTLWAQEVTPDQFLKSESEIKTRLWEMEKQHVNDEILLDQNDYDSKYWELHFDVTNISGQILTGKVALTNQSNIDNLTSIDYNFAGAMTVDTVIMNGGHVAFSRPTNVLRITLDRAYNIGELFTTTVYYHGHPYPTGFGSFTYNNHNGVPIVSSLSCPYGARDWWPCKDIQHDKADHADVYITCDTSYTGVSNGIMVENRDNGNGTHTFHWAISYPITSYLICLSVTNYQSFTDWYIGLNGQPMPITNYVYPENYDNRVINLSIAPEALHIYASYFGEYPFLREKFGYSEFPWNGGMEHQENVFIGYFSSWIIVHEMAHMWFGDAITCDTWADSWMNEGFATYCQAIYAEGLYGLNNYISTMQSLTPSDPSGPIYDYFSIFDQNTIYWKGAWVLHMLRGVMGDSAFFQGMRAYVVNPDHLYGTITTREFQHLMEPFYGDSLGWFFDEWVWGMNRPSYRYSWTKTSLGNGRYEVYLHVRQVQSSPAPDIFTMPIKITPRINNVDTLITVWDNARIEDFQFVVNGNPATIAFDSVPWILRDAASESYALNIVTTSLPNDTAGVAYMDTIEARGGTRPYHFTVQSGHFPTGLNLGNTTGVISGIPTTAEVDTFTILCTDSSSPARTDNQTYVVTISPSPTLIIVTSSLPDGRQDSIYENTIVVVGGVQPYNFSVTSGHLPSGLVLDTTDGIISGIPTTVEIDTFTILCEDSSLPPLTDDQIFTVSIAPTAGCPYISGDINGDGIPNGIDVVYTVNYFKGSGLEPSMDCFPYCPLTPNPFYAAGDVNGNCAFNGIDITFFVRYLKSQVPSLLCCPDCPPQPR
jgi:aminopeptidase N